MNVLEFIALFLAFLVFEAKDDEVPTKFPLTQVLNPQGDSMSANAWLNKISTVSTHVLNMLQVYQI